MCKHHRGEAPTKKITWVQTILQVRESEGKREAKRLKAEVVQDRTQATLQGNIEASVLPRSAIQTDGWPGYKQLAKNGYKHDWVNHKKTFVTTGNDGKKICTNTVEGVHSSLKRKASQLSLLCGSKVNKTILKNKVQELVWRFNHREEEDKFFVILKIVSVYYKRSSLSELLETSVLNKVCIDPFPPLRTEN